MVISCVCTHTHHKKWEIKNQRKYSVYFYLYANQTWKCRPGEPYNYHHLKLHALINNMLLLLHILYHSVLLTWGKSTYNQLGKYKISSSSLKLLYSLGFLKKHKRKIFFVRGGRTGQCRQGSTAKTGFLLVFRFHRVFNMTFFVVFFFSSGLFVGCCMAYCCSIVAE